MSYRPFFLYGDNAAPPDDDGPDDDGAEERGHDWTRARCHSCDDFAIDGKVTCGRAECGSTTGQDR